MALGCQRIVRGEFGVSPFRGQVSGKQSLDRAGKLHGYRINAHVRLGQKHRLTVCRFRRVAARHGKLTANYPWFIELASIRIGLCVHESTPGEALAAQTLDMPQKMA
jgi:hypothetical protein